MKKKVALIFLWVGLLVLGAQARAAFPGGQPDLSARVHVEQVRDENGIPQRASEITIHLPGRDFRLVIPMASGSRR